MTLGIQSSQTSSRTARAERFLTEWLAKADIRFNWDRPWDIQVHNPDFYPRIMAQGSLGSGESYMDGWWACEQMDEMFSRLLGARLDHELPTNWILVMDVIKSKLINRQNKRWSKTVAQQHYDLGNDFYKDMLDPFMQYTCAYWKDAQNLNQAQEQKLDLICRKLGMKRGMKVLELGCGWGGFAHFAAERYGCEVTALNISEEQVAYAREYNRNLPVDIQLKDYRDATGLYDRVVSIGMCEHIGYKNYGTFFEVIHRSLKDDGMALVHTIGGNASVVGMEPWLDKYIFPHAVLPSIRQLSHQMEHRFVVEDWHNFGADYDHTLMAWHANFVRHWPMLRERYGERFFRMWSYYLLSSAGSFRRRAC